MNYFVICLFLLASLQINAQAKNTTNNCNVEMTKSAITLKKLSFECKALKNKTIAEFKFKVPKQKTVSIKGSQLNAEARKYASTSKVGDTVILFDIKLESGESLDPISITIIK